MHWNLQLLESSGGLDGGCSTEALTVEGDRRSVRRPILTVAESLECEFFPYLPPSILEGLRIDTAASVARPDRHLTDAF
jgi:hypothetical protein